MKNGIKKKLLPPATFLCFGKANEFALPSTYETPDISALFGYLQLFHLVS